MKSASRCSNAALIMVALAVGLWSWSGIAIAQPTPDPLPWEVIDGNTIRDRCMVRGRPLQAKIFPNEIACINEVTSQMPKLNPAQRDRFGARYEPQKYAECLQRGYGMWSGDCEYMLLQRVPAPEYWPFPDTPRPKVPLPDLDKVYRKGITQKKYFDALCGAFAGEFVYRAVENVAGIYQIRPRPHATGDAEKDPYVMEDPYGYYVGEGAGSMAVYLSGTKERYAFGEAPRVLGYDRNLKLSSLYVRETIRRGAIRSDFVASEKVESSYGYTWRDITGIRERELAIAGGDLIVVDLRSGEVLGMRRGFARSAVLGSPATRVSWPSTENCPLIDVLDGRVHRLPHLDYWFLKKVLKPAIKGG